MPSLTADTDYPTLRMERMNSNNLAAVEQLYIDVYGKAPAAGYFKRKYDTGWMGIRFMGFIAFNEKGMAVSFSGAVPCHIIHQQQKVKAAQSVDLMTHPDYRNKSIFVRLTALIFDLCKQEGFTLMFGFPNQHSLHSVIHKLHWRQLTSMQCFLIPVPQIPLLRQIKKIPVMAARLKKYHNRILIRYQNTAASISNSVSEENAAGVEYSNAYVKYKLQQGSCIIAIANAVVWLHGKQDMMLGNISGMDNHNFLPVMQELKKIARKSGMPHIQFHCCPGTALHQLFAQHYTPLPSYPVMVQDFGSAIAPEHLRFTFADLDIF